MMQKQRCLILSTSALNVLTDFWRSLSLVLALAFPAQLATAQEIQNAEPKPSLTVFAAASLADVLPALGNEWRMTANGSSIQISMAASAASARQIVSGARADLFLSANRRWVDYVQESGKAHREPMIIATNSLVLAMPCSQTSNAPTSLPELATLLRTRRFAMADPAIAPAGDYARGFLKHQQLWQDVESNAALAGNARLTLLLIERGGLPGIVYGSDASRSRLACMAMTLDLPESLAVRYFALVLDSPDAGRMQAAEDFASWMTSSAAHDVWTQFGFSKNVSN